MNIGYKFLLPALVSIFVLTACSNDRYIGKEIRQVEIPEVIIHRYDQALFSIDRNDIRASLIRLSDEFLPFLDADLDDPQNIKQIEDFLSDTTVIHIHNSVSEHFKDLKFFSNDLADAFRHIKFYFPAWEPPVVYTYVSGLYYEVPVRYDGQSLLIALDMYLGEDFELYRKAGFPQYKIKRMNTDYLLADCIDEIIREIFVPATLPANMLDKMIAEGKVLYLLDRFIPWVQDEYKIGYTKADLKWCMKNEPNMWAYFIENELLFTSDPLIINRFVNDGPFTAPFHRDSPARTALWMGWQIVRAYMNKKSGTDLNTLIQMNDSNAILQASAYRPGRMRF